MKRELQAVTAGAVTLATGAAGAAPMTAWAGPVRVDLGNPLLNGGWRDQSRAVAGFRHRRVPQGRRHEQHGTGC